MCLLLQPRDWTAQVSHYTRILCSLQTLLKLCSDPCHFWSVAARLCDFHDTGVYCTGYKCDRAFLPLLPIAPRMHPWAWALLAAVLWRKLLFSSRSLSWVSIPSHCFPGKKRSARSWSNTDCTTYPQRFDLAALKWNLFLWTQVPRQFSLVSSPDLLWSLITTALVFVSLANLDLLPGHWYLYWCLNCSSCESLGREDMGLHFTGETEELIYCWGGK